MIAISNETTINKKEYKLFLFASKLKNIEMMSF